MRPLRSLLSHGAPLTTFGRRASTLAIPVMNALCDSHYPAPARKQSGDSAIHGSSRGPHEGGSGLASWQRGWSIDQPIILEDDSDVATPPASGSAPAGVEDQADVDQASTQMSHCSLEDSSASRSAPPPASPPRPNRQQRRPLVELSPTQQYGRTIKMQRKLDGSEVSARRSKTQLHSASARPGNEEQGSLPRQNALGTAGLPSRGWRLGDAIRLCDELARGEDPEARMDDFIRTLDAERDQAKGKAKERIEKQGSKAVPSSRFHAASRSGPSSGSSLLHPQSKGSGRSSSFASYTPHRTAAAFNPPRRGRKSWGSTWSGGQRRHQSSHASSKEMRKTELERGLEVYALSRPAGTIPWASGLQHDAPAPIPEVHVTRDLAEAERLLDSIELGTPLSVDLEWPCNLRTGRSGRVALVQIASPGSIIVLQLTQMGKVPEALRRLMEDDSTMKCGVAIVADGKKLHRDWGVVSRSLVELSTLAKQADAAHWTGRHSLISLRDLTRIYLGRKLLKDSVRTSNWETTVLNSRQIEYAACDVYSGLEIYFRLLQRIDDRAAGIEVSPVGEIAVAGGGQEETAPGPSEPRSDATADRLRSGGGWFSREIELMADAAGEPEVNAVTSTLTVQVTESIESTSLPSITTSTATTEIPIFKPPQHSNEGLRALRQSSFDLHQALEQARAAKEAAKLKLEAAVAAGGDVQAKTTTSNTAATRSSTSTASTTTTTTGGGVLSHQRAYAFWLEGKTLAEVACLMRSEENPLALSTVGAYVLRAVTESKDKLSERDLKRARAVALRPEVKIARARLRWALRKAGVIDEPGSDSGSASDSPSGAVGEVNQV